MPKKPINNNDGLPVSEMFLSIQGEPQSVGKLSLFIRVEGCNLKCEFCDTKYASQSKPENWEWIPMEKILQEINKSKANQVVITGGEPLLYQKQIKWLANRSPKEIEIETNGTIDALGINGIRYNVSPKLSNSGNKNVKYQGVESFLKEQAIFKFVVACPEDIDEVKKFTAKHKINHSRVYLMPEGADKEPWNTTATELIETIIQEGFNFAPRLQIQIWGKKRGV